MRSRRQLNKYERKMLRPFYVFWFLFFLEVVSTIVVFKLNVSVILKIFQLFNVFVSAKALAGGLGYFEQKPPILGWSYNRSFEAAYLFTMQFKNGYFWKVYLAVLLLDVIFLACLYYDRSVYEYESEDSVSD